MKHFIRSILIGVTCFVVLYTAMVGGADYSHRIINNYAKDWIEEYYDTESYSYDYEFVNSLKINGKFYYVYKISIQGEEINRELLLLLDSVDPVTSFEVYERTKVDAKMVEIR